MKNFSLTDLVKLRAQALSGYYASGVIDLNAGLSVTYSDNIPDQFWNFAFGAELESFHSQRLPNICTTLHRVENALGRRGRNVALFVENRQSIQRIKEILGTPDFETSDLWWTVSAEDIALPLISDMGENYRIEPVTNDAMMTKRNTIFQQIFEAQDAGYYDGFARFNQEYRAAAAAKPETGAVFQHYLGYSSSDEPSAIISYCFNPKSDLKGAGIYNLCSLPGVSVRLASYMQNHAIIQAFKAGAEFVFNQSNEEMTAKYARYAKRFSKREDDRSPVNTAFNAQLLVYSL